MDDTKKTTTRRGKAELLNTASAIPSAEAPSAAPILDGYMTEDQLAKEIDRSVRTIARWRAIGEGPRYVRLGRQIFYRKTSVAAWLAGLEQEVA